MSYPYGFNGYHQVNQIDDIMQISRIFEIFSTVLATILDIPAAGNHQSGEMETSCPEFGNHLDWVIVSRSEITVLSSPQPHCGAKQAFTIQEFLINSLHPIRSGKAVSLKTDSRFPHVRNGGFLMPGLGGHERRNTQIW